MLIKSDDPRVAALHFRDFYNPTERRAEQYLPDPREPQSIDLKTPWGDILTAKAGDYLVSDADDPAERWPVDRKIFEESYVFVRPGYCVKKAVTQLAPLVDLTDGDPDAIVKVETLEGVETVRAGDFYLARGVKGEIWPYPKEEAAHRLVPVDHDPPDHTSKVFGNF